MLSNAVKMTFLKLEYKINNNMRVEILGYKLNVIGLILTTAPTDNKISKQYKSKMKWNS